MRGNAACSAMNADMSCGYCSCLSLSKIEAGQLSLVFAAHNMSDVCESACLLCYDMAATKGLTLSWYIDPELPPRLRVDSARLQQILMNLLSNGQTRCAGCDCVSGMEVAANRLSLFCVSSRCRMLCSDQIHAPRWRGAARRRAEA